MPLDIPEDLRQIDPFTPGLNPRQVAVRFGVEADEVVKLGSGENPFGPSPAAVNAVQRNVSSLHLYPEWTSQELRDAVARAEGVEPSQVICGTGETEIIGGLIRAFSTAGDEVLMHHATFPVYHQYAEVERRRAVFAELGADTTLSVEDLIAKITERTRVIFLTSPHNPTGRVVLPADIQRVATAAPRALVVVDEAYIHFSEQSSSIGLIADHDNVIVLRTFSKAYGLASLRVGFGIASDEIVAVLMRTKPTWNLGALQVAGAVAALEDDEHVSRTTDMVVAARRRMQHAIDDIPGLTVLAGSEANFVLVRIDTTRTDSTQLHHALAARGLVVKDCSVSYQGLSDRHVRIDVADDTITDRLVTALRAAVVV